MTVICCGGGIDMGFAGIEGATGGGSVTALSVQPFNIMESEAAMIGIRIRLRMISSGVFIG